MIKISIVIKHQNIKFGNKKLQAEYVYIQKYLLRTTDINKEKDYIDKDVSVILTSFIMKRTSLEKFVCGKVTLTTPKAIQLNYTQWLPKSQIERINVIEYPKKRQTKIIEFLQ